MSQMQATIQSLHSAAHTKPPPPLGATKETPKGGPLYAVARGHWPESVGVHLFQTAVAEVKGVAGALWQRAKLPFWQHLQYCKPANF
jgi:hypothetical protein